MARRTADERREHVLDAAIAEFAAQGYHAASTTAIARRAGISQPYIYALYRNKRELFLAAYRHVAERIRARLVGAADAGADPEARLAAMGEAYLGLIGDRGGAESERNGHEREAPALGAGQQPADVTGTARSSRRNARPRTIDLRIRTTVDK